MSALVIEILLILLLIAVNGMLAMAEIAVVSARRVRLQQRANGGDAGARVALELASEPTRFLSTVQIGITLVGILAGVFAGATVAEYLAAGLRRLPAVAPYADAASLAIVVVTITYLSLVIGELLPKRLALSNPERVASRVARPMRLLSRLAAPAVHVLSASTGLLMRLMGVKQGKEPPVTAEEINILLAQGESAGVFEATEQDIVESALNLDDLRVGALITPRTEIVWLDVDAPPQESEETILRSRHSYFPAARTNLDNVLGLVWGRDVLRHRVTGQPVDLQKLMAPPHFVPESQSALRLLQLFKRTGQHMVLVIDEFGGLMGLVTVGDVMEALVGAIHVPGREGEPEAVRNEDGSWLLDGRLALHQVEDLLDLPGLPEAAATEYHTLGGLVMATLSRVPQQGESFDFGGWRFEVVRMDGKRVDQVRVTRLPAPSDRGGADGAE